MSPELGRRDEERFFVGREKIRGSPREAVIAEIRPLPAMAARGDLARTAGHDDAGDASHAGDPYARTARRRRASTVSAGFRDCRPLDAR